MQQKKRIGPQTPLTGIRCSRLDCTYSIAETAVENHLPDQWTKRQFIHEAIWPESGFYFHLGHASLLINWISLNKIHIPLFAKAKIENGDPQSHKAIPNGSTDGSSCR
jgi:hypothetical protein